MLVINSEDVTPKDVRDLIGTTRENARSVQDYTDILGRLGMPSLPTVPEGRILEIGTGRGNSLAGLLALSQQRGHVVSVDIDAETLRRIPVEKRDVDIAVHEGAAPERSDGQLPRIDVVIGDAEIVALPRQYFDLAVSIWVLYQVKDKFKAVANVLASLKPGGRLVACAAGSVCTVPRALPAALLSEARTFVWNHRATRFSWLTGTRELGYFLAREGVPHRIESVGDFLGRRTRFRIEPAKTTPAEFPEGHFVLTSSDGAAGLPGMELVSFVSTRYSAFVPIYVDSGWEGPSA
jgi:SAM-dependent methyltransferase